MNKTRVDEYHSHGYHFHGKLVVIDYSEDMTNDPDWGKFGANVWLDYANKAKIYLREHYGTDNEILLSIPELVARLR